MKLSFIPGISLLILLPQCASINEKKIFEPVQEEVYQRVGKDPSWHPFSYNKEIVNTLMSKGITINTAVAIALDHNPAIQAHFEELGISKADLIQAGFYTNPYVQTVFKIPQQSDNRTNIDISASFLLSDLWQVPLRKKVAEDALTIETYKVINEILMLRAEVQKRYTTCLYQKEQLSIITELVEMLETLKNRITYRSYFGYTNDLDIYVTESRVGEWNAKQIQAESALQQAYIALYAILGAEIVDTPIALRTPLHPLASPPTQRQLKEYALASHPYILIERAKITKAEHTMSYEKSRVIDTVELGIAYERDFEARTSGVGPLFGISIPLFNTNDGNIERAQFERIQAQKTLAAQKQMILKDIATYYTQYNAYCSQIKEYQKRVLPPAVKALSFSKTFFDRMQMNMIVFLETQINLYEQKLQFLDLVYQATLSHIDLELAVGAQLNI